jgi:hypothetical protein
MFRGLNEGYAGRKPTIVSELSLTDSSRIMTGAVRNLLGHQIAFRGAISAVLASGSVVALWWIGVRGDALSTLSGDLLPTSVGTVGILLAALTIFASLPIEVRERAPSAFTKTLNSYRSTILYATLLSALLLLMRLVDFDGRGFVWVLVGSVLTMFYWLLAMLLGLVRATTEAMERSL